jgi:3-oxoadipate enol-lactonase/4-carboxymuconolactone decarboxylase
MTLRWQLDGPAGAPALVLLNSLGTTTDMWSPCLAPLSEQFRVIRIDTRGHGGSPPPPAQAPCDIADLSRDVLAVLDELGLERVDLAGLSLGGMIGMWLAAHEPERIRRLALLCSTSLPANPDGYLARAETVRREGMSAVAGAVLRLWLTEDLAGRDPQLAEQLRTMLLSVDAEGYAQCCQAIAALNLGADLSRIASPTLVISGADDPAAPPEHGRAIASGIVGSRLEIIGPAAHLATYEQPGRIAALLLEHFRAGATLQAGYRTRRQVLGDAHVDRTIAETTELTAPFQDFITRYAWGEVWSRPELSRRDRTIATLAALVTLGAEHEIAMHVRAAIRNGLTPAEIGEVLLHTAVYAGLPRANRALAIARQTLDE